MSEQANGNGTAQQPQPNPANEFRNMLEKYKKQIAMALPKHLTPERMIRMATTTFARNPGLQECNLVSVLSCVIQAAELGLELSGPLGHAYMVPYWNKDTRRKEAQFQVGYRGFIDLAYRSGRVKTFASFLVHANDKFRYRLGTDPCIEHIPAMGERGEVTYAYAVLRMKNGGIDFEVMSKAEIDEHRKKYSKQKEGGAFNPWNTAWNEMAKKTPIRRLAKRAPMSIEMVQAAVLDEYAENGLNQELTTIDMPVTLPAIEDRSATMRAEAAMAERAAGLGQEEPELVHAGGGADGEVADHQEQHAEMRQDDKVRREGLLKTFSDLLSKTGSSCQAILDDCKVPAIQKMTDDQLRDWIGRMQLYLQDQQHQEQPEQPKPAAAGGRRRAPTMSQ